MRNKQAVQTMALAAVCQAAWLVQQVARHGSCDEESMRCLLQGILITDPDKAESVYPNHTLLRNGYSTLVEQLGNNRNPKNVEFYEKFGFKVYGVMEKNFPLKQYCLIREVQ